VVEFEQFDIMSSEAKILLMHLHDLEKKNASSKNSLLRVHCLVWSVSVMKGIFLWENII